MPECQIMLADTACWALPGLAVIAGGLRPGLIALFRQRAPAALGVRLRSPFSAFLFSISVEFLQYSPASFNVASLRHVTRDRLFRPTPSSR